MQDRLTLVEDSHDDLLAVHGRERRDPEIDAAAAGRVIGRWFLARILNAAGEFARRNYPETSWNAKRVSGLALAYVLDVLFQYCRANGDRIDPNDLVVQSYWSLMERRSTWMAS